MTQDMHQAIMDALMAKAYDFAHLHHGYITMDANAANLIADVVVEVIEHDDRERTRLRAAVGGVRVSLTSLEEQLRRRALAFSARGQQSAADEALIAAGDIAAILDRLGPKEGT